MNLTEPQTEMSIRVKGGKYRVRLESVGNPDYRQDETRSLPGVPKKWAHVEDLAEAAKLCRQFIEMFDLGGGNWSGGEVQELPSKKPIGRVAYGAASLNGARMAAGQPI